MSADGRKFAKCRRAAAKLPQGLAVPGGRAPFIGAIAGAALVLWVWRMIQ
jgi:uncharacterized membrane protein YeaQ/YmgE (transglycosylase-associated protein family)